MQKLKAIQAVFLAALFVTALSAVAFAGAQDFVLVNNTGYPIHRVNVSPASTDNWEEDILGSDILPNGKAVHVNFGAGNTQYWDINAIFGDGSSIAWFNIDLLSTHQVTLNNDGTATLE